MLQKISIKSRFLAKRNGWWWALTALIAIECLLNNKGVHQQATIELQARMSAEIDSLRSNPTGLLLLKQAEQRGEYLVENNRSMNRLNHLAAAARRADAKAYNESVARNDSAYNAAVNLYTTWLANENRKIEGKYERLFSAGDGRLPITGRTGFAMMIPILAFAGVWLFSRCYDLRASNNGNVKLAFFEGLGGFTAISAQVSSAVMVYYCILAWFDSALYAGFGAVAWSAGVLTVSACTTLIDRAALTSAMDAEIEAVPVAPPSQRRAAEKASDAPMKTFWRAKGPLDIDLAPYQKIEDLPLDLEFCAKIYAAFEHQQGSIPAWLSYSTIGTYMTSNYKKFAQSSFSMMVKRWRAKKAA